MRQMICAKNIGLRDLTESDIKDRIYWEKVETEWQQWDAPWEYEGLSEEEKENEFKDYVNSLHKRVERCRNMPAEQKRYTFEIVTLGEKTKHIGWVSAYSIDENCNFIEGDGHCTVGIDIPDRSDRGQGYGGEALCAFINYLHGWGEQDFYTQTWSGNRKMIHLAEKMGFEEYRRKEGIRLVQGKKYDGLTFRLDWEKYGEFYDKYFRDFRHNF